MAKKRTHGQGTLYKRGGKGSWIASWFDYDGRRRSASTKTTDRAAAQRILAKKLTDAALRRDGVIDPRMDRFAIEGRKSLVDHVGDYLAHCRHIGQATKHLDEKQRHLKRLLNGTGATRLSDLTFDSLERHLSHLKTEGLSARTVNFRRQVAVAFASWCVKTGRLESNPLKVVPRLDERKDRRRVRRPLTDDELARLLEVAADRGRKAWYLAAALAGLRKGDLQRLRWCDVNFENNTITVSEGKAKRDDLIPMHPQLAVELATLRGQSMTVPTAAVFPTTVTDRTRQADFKRAGIPLQDDEGRVADLHAMRTTLGTNLARAGVAPQLAQRIMRHGDYKTTLKHYTVLGVTDTAKAIEALPGIDHPESDATYATGTHGDHDEPQFKRQQYRQQCERETLLSDATIDEKGHGQREVACSSQTVGNAGLCETMQSDAIMLNPQAGVTQLVECQPSKLNVVGSNPIARFCLSLSLVDNHRHKCHLPMIWPNDVCWSSCQRLSVACLDCLELVQALVQATAKRKLSFCAEGGSDFTYLPQDRGTSELCENPRIPSVLSVVRLMCRGFR